MWPLLPCHLLAWLICTPRTVLTLSIPSLGLYQTFLVLPSTPIEQKGPSMKSLPAIELSQSPLIQAEPFHCLCILVADQDQDNVSGVKGSHKKTPKFWTLSKTPRYPLGWYGRKKFGRSDWAQTLNFKNFKVKKEILVALQPKKQSS